MSEIVPEFGGCPWPVDPACLGDEWDSFTDPIKDRAVALASETLHRLTGYRVGGCPITVRPLAQQVPCAPCGPSVTYYASGSFNPYINAFGQWVNNCGAMNHCEIDLPGPVGRVDEVKVDGVALDEADYRIDDGHILTWQGIGDCPWTAALLQDPTRPDTEDGTMSVTYLNAYPVDSIGAYAAGIMAAEFARACMGNKCRLPSTVTSITRQGVSFEVISGSFPGGVTGIREVDTFITLWNPDALRQRSTVWSPDAARPRVTG